MLEIDDEHPSKLLHREITEKVIGAAFEVNRELGYGFLERVYQRALQVELLRADVSAEIEKRIQVTYKGVVVGEYDADLIVEDCVAIELKVTPQYDKRDEAQLLNELKATGIRLGLLSTLGARKSSTSALYSKSVFHPCSSVAEVAPL